MKNYSLKIIKKSIVAVSVFIWMAQCSFDSSAQVIPNDFGSQFWTASCFNGNNFQTYRGFYTTSDMDFDTRDSWDENQSPSLASNYSGQSVNTNHHSVRFERSGFDCGFYNLNIPAVRRMVALYVDDELVFQAGGNGASHSSVWSGFLNENSTIVYELRSMTGASYASLEFEEIESVSSVWNGSIDEDWFNENNWSNGIPEAYTDAVLTGSGFSPEISDDVAEVRNITIESGSTLSITSGSVLILTGDLVNSGSLEAVEGIIEFTDNCLTASQELNTSSELIIGQLKKSGSGSLAITAEHVKIKEVLHIESGTLNTGNRITLISDMNGTARLAPVLSGAEILGEITAERYFEANQHGWIQLASPVEGQTFENWNEFILMTGFPGSDYPNFNFNNIRMYDETLIGHMDTGLYNASNIIEPIEMLKGYQIYTSQGTYTISLSGEPIVGDQDFGVTFTSSVSEYDEAFSQEHDGWNLIANPYASAIDWDAPTGWQKANLTGAIHVWDATIGQYNMYADGVGINGGSRYIPSSQAFWVQATDDNPILTINELAKTHQQGEFKNQSAPDVLYLTLSGTNSYDQVALRLFDGVNQLQSIDIPKLYSNLAVPKLGITGPNETDWGLMNIAENSAAQIVLTHALPSEGQFSIALDVQAQNYINCIFLEDTETGEWVDILANPYVFQGEQTDLTERFILHLGEPLSIETSAVSCSGLQNGTISWIANENWNVNFAENIDLPGIEVANGTVTGLPAGTYQLEVASVEQCAIDDVFEVYIEAPASIQVDIEVEHTYCQDTHNGVISLVPSGGISPYSVEWFDGQTDWQRNNLPQGDYTFNVTDANGCEFSELVNVNVINEVQASFSLFEEVLIPGAYFVPQNNSTPADFFIWSKGDGSESLMDFAPQLSYDTPGVYTLKLTAVKGLCTDEFEQEVQVNGIVTDIESESASQTMNIFTQQGEIIIETELQHAIDLHIEVYNIAGQRMLADGFHAANGTRWRFPFDYTGVFLVHLYNNDYSVHHVARVFID